MTHFHHVAQGVIGFTLSRSSVIAEDIRSNPHVCQLQQHDQGLDALFFTFDFEKLRLLVVRSGELGRQLELCHSSAEWVFITTFISLFH